MMANIIVQKRKIFVNQCVSRDEGHPELADLVANEKERRAAERSD